MNTAPSHLVFLAGMAIYLGIRITFQRRLLSQQKSVSKTSARDRLLIVLVGVGQLGLPLVFLFTPWLDWANQALPQVATWAGCAVMAAALWLFWRSHADLGNSWSVTLELNPGHRLVTQGVYRVVRHPMYASFFLLGFAQALLLNNWLAGMAALAAVALLYILRIPHEEQMMIECFGDDYRAYMRRTGGILPRLKAASDS